MAQVGRNILERKPTIEMNVEAMPKPMRKRTSNYMATDVVTSARREEVRRSQKRKEALHTEPPEIADANPMMTPAGVR